MRASSGLREGPTGPTIIELASTAPGRHQEGWLWTDAVIAFLALYPLVVIDGPIAKRAAVLRRANRWKLPDAIQAAATEALGARLATRNTKDFPPTRHPWVHVPYELAMT